MSIRVKSLLVSVFLFHSATLADELTDPGRSRKLDEQYFDFRDHHDGHVIGDVRAILLREHGRNLLEITVSAVGPLVEPPPGFRGLRGSNRITAEELESLLTEHGLTLETRAGTEDRVHYGQVREGRRGHLPERRVLADGTIDFEALSRRIYPLELVLLSQRTGTGLHETDWKVDGSARLRVTTEVEGLRGRIVSIEGLAPRRGAVPHQEIVRGSASSTPPAFAIGPPEAEPVTPPVDLAEWEARDREGRWMLLKRSVEEAPSDKWKAWVAFLAARKEFELLEWLAIYEPGTFRNLGVGEALMKADAPAWVRVAIWTVDTTDSHTVESAEKRVLLERPGYSLAWLEKYPFAIQGVKGIHEELLKIKVPREDVSRALPPLEPREVFAHLDAPGDVEDFGERKRAEPGKVYVHQVLRAIEGLVRKKTRDEVSLEKLFLLTKHPNVAIRRQAFLAYTHFPSELIPHEPFLAVVHENKELLAMRQAALLAASYSLHPEVSLTLLDLALQPQHPAWRAAVSRLGDVGDEIALQFLDDLAAADIAAGDVPFLRTETKRLRDRVKQQETRGHFLTANSLRRRLERAAWADLGCHLLEGRLVSRTLESVRQHVKDPKVLAELEKLRTSYVPQWTDKTRFSSLQARVREYAARIRV